MVNQHFIPNNVPIIGQRTTEAGIFGVHLYKCIGHPPDHTYVRGKNNVVNIVPHPNKEEILITFENGDVLVHPTGNLDRFVFFANPVDDTASNTGE
jgi:hypothetical protein